MTPLDVQALRAETPGTRHRIHLNNAGAGLMPTPVLRAITEHLELEARIGGYEAAEERKEEIASVYRALASLLGTHPANVAVTENATASFVQALSSVAFDPGDVILTTRNDYVSNQIMYLSLKSRMGIDLVRAPEDPAGGVDVMAMDEVVHRRRPKLVAVTHVPTNSGLVQRIADVGAICRRRNVLYLVDACQSVGQMPLDVEEIGCDFLSATSRKFLRGPRGIGFLYVSDRAMELELEPLFLDMRGAHWIDADLYQPVPDAQRFENWEFPYALVLGLGRAVEYALALGLDALRERAWALAELARERLASIDAVRVLDVGAERCAIVTATTEGRRAADIVTALSEARINTTVTQRDYAVLDFDHKGVESAIRVSPHYYNTEEEIEEFASALAALLS